MSVHIETVGDLKRHGYTLHAWCWTCGTGRVADLDLVVARLGPDFPNKNLSGKLTCRTCGKREVSCSLSPPQAHY